VTASRISVCWCRRVDRARGGLVTVVARGAGRGSRRRFGATNGRDESTRRTVERRHVGWSAQDELRSRVRTQSRRISRSPATPVSCQGPSKIDPRCPSKTDPLVGLGAALGQRGPSQVAASSLAGGVAVK
jgi:hypothetical protein